MPMLGDIIERAQAGATAHTGMHPRGSDDSQRVQAVRASLMRDLEAAITAEQYERAASIRDQLTSLDGGNP
jgi:protein-arginine kinase activator protein McsA